MAASAADLGVNHMLDRLFVTFCAVQVLLQTLRLYCIQAAS